jgi:flagellar biosynthetic protein FlhB
MAQGNDSAQDRHLPASQRKIRKAREDGQVARSRDLGHFATVAGGGALLVALAPTFTGWLRELVANGLTFDARSLAGPAPMVEHLGQATLRMMAVLLPLGAALIAVALAAGVLAGGWNWTLKPIAPKFDKFNPLSGLGRVFSKQQLGETLKACALALVLGALGSWWLRSHASDFTRTLGLPLPAAIAHGAATLQAGLLLLAFALGAFALIDVPLQRKRLLDRLKMSHQEMKEEFKQLEGNLEVKNKVRAKMREMANRRMLAAVPKADIVVMNPTHYAVALRYDDATMVAPRVVAKGADLMALKIRDIAKESKVPVLQAPPLARALYAHAEIDREVPATLFAAVAQVLAWVYQLRAAMNGDAAMPAALPALPVPEELDPHRGAQEDEA